MQEKVKIKGDILAKRKPGLETKLIKWHTFTCDTVAIKCNKTPGQNINADYFHGNKKKLAL